MKNFAKIKIPRHFQQQQNSKGFYLILSIVLFFIIILSYFVLDQSKNVPPSKIYNFSASINNQELMEILITDVGHLDFVKNIDHLDGVKYKVLEIENQVNQYEIEHSYVFPQYHVQRMWSILPLQHKKFTTCITQPPFIGSIFKIFGFDKCYQGIENVVLENNMKTWKSDGNKLTVYFNGLIVPYYFYIRVPENKQSSQIHLFGFRVQENTIVAAKTLSSYYLGTYILSQYTKYKQGGMYLPCLNKECQLSYEFLMITMQQIEINQIGVFVSDIDQ